MTGPADTYRELVVRRDSLVVAFRAAWAGQDVDGIIELCNELHHLDRQILELCEKEFR